MTSAHFAAAVAAELHVMGAAFDRGDLEQFIADSWPLIEETPDGTLWAREFIGADDAAGVRGA
jgi:hypothetical protein